MLTRKNANLKIPAFLARILLGMVAVMLLGFTAILAGCNNLDNYSDGDLPPYYEEKYLFLDVGETTELNIHEIFKHSGINISEYVLRSSSEWVADVKDNAVTAHRAGNQKIGFIGHTTISAVLYDSDAHKKYNTPVAQVFVVNELEMTEIKSAEDLIAIRENLGGWYVLKSDIDLSGVEWQGINGVFTGMFVNGGEFAISNLTGTAGLFEDNQGYIDGVILENVSIDRAGSDDYSIVGAVASSNGGLGAATVTNSRIKGKVKSTGVSGGAVGHNTGRVIGCSFDGIVVSESNRTANEILSSGNFYDVAGGIVGINDGVVAHSTASGQISSLLIAGGVVGIHFSALSNARIVNSDFVFTQGLTDRIIAPIWGRVIGWEQTLVGRN